MALELLQTLWKLCPLFGGPTEACPPSLPQTSTSWSCGSGALGERCVTPSWHPPAAGPPGTSCACLGPGWRGQVAIGLVRQCGEAAVESVCCAVYLCSFILGHPVLPKVTSFTSVGGRRVQPKYSRVTVTRFFLYSVGISIISFFPRCVHVRFQNLSVIEQPQGQLCGAVSHYSFISISLMTNLSQKFFTRLLAIHIWYFGKYLFKSFTRVLLDWLLLWS